MSTEENTSASEVPADTNGASTAEGPEVLGSHCCDTCIGDNLLKDIGIKQCCRCGNPFCVHFASKYDCIHLCVSCGSEVELSKNDITRDITIERYDALKDKVTTIYRKSYGKEYKLSGETWMFMQRRINTMSDAELDIAIEVHRQYLQLLCDDQERRRAEKAHRNANVKFIMPTTTTTSSTTTETKKVTVIKTDKAKEKASAAMQVLLSQGLSMEQILKLLGGIK